jgi:CRP/FNR family transcriptional regulator, anaerobic regulatory protein
MNTELLKYQINSIVSLSDAEWLHFSSFLELKTLKRNEHLLQEGEICNFISFINSGILIYFKFLENGKLVTTDFAFMADWVTDNHSRLNHSPSQINIKAITTSEILILKNNNLEYLYEKIPKIERLSRILMEKAFTKFTELSMDLQILTARERYFKMVTHHPDLPQKVPLYHIANYLGIAPKSLSRIRNDISLRR